FLCVFFFSSRRRHTSSKRDWSSDVCSSDLDEDLPIFPHVFRHSAAECYTDGTHYALSEMGRDKLEISELKILMRHENIDITNSYLKNKDDEILESLFK